MDILVREPANRDVLSLVEPTRVHSDVFTSPDIFELELSKIFYGSWVYVGHASEVPKTGDFVTRTIGRQPVIMVRGNDNVVRVFMNRCRHRGALICETERGSEQHFRCWYHGWTYENTGSLIHIPEEGGYGPGFCRADFSLSKPPQVDDYRGFVFASLNADVPSLSDYLGLAAGMIDLLVDASPLGEVALDMGCQKTIFNGNWKQIGMDGYHPNYLHVSVMAKRSKNENGQPSRTAGAEFFSSSSWSDASESVTRDLGNGHSMLDIMPQRIKKAASYMDELRRFEGGSEYIDAMHRAHGKERGDLLVVMAGDPHLGLYPNAQITANQVRIFVPLAADKTEILMFPARLVGVSDAINTNRVRNHESFYGPCGAGSPDDAEIFERTQRGLQARVDPWIDLSRGMHREYVDADGSIVGKITDEVPQRAQMKRWRQLMSDHAEMER